MASSITHNHCVSVIWGFGVLVFPLMIHTHQRPRKTPDGFPCIWRREPQIAPGLPITSEKKQEQNKIIP